MDDAFRVCSVECIGDLDGERQNQLGVHGTPGNSVLQRHTVEKLHGDERLPVLLANVVNRANIGVIQSGRGLGFTLKTRECLRVSSNFIGKELQCDEAAKVGVLVMLGFIVPILVAIGLIARTWAKRARALDQARQT